MYANFLSRKTRKKIYLNFFSVLPHHLISSADPELFVGMSFFFKGAGLKLIMMTKTLETSCDCRDIFISSRPDRSEIFQSWKLLIHAAYSVGRSFFKLDSLER